MFWARVESHSLIICKNIDSERRGYLNFKKILFGNPFQQSASERNPNTAKKSMAALSSYDFIIPRLIEMGNVPLSQIWTHMIIFNTSTAEGKYSRNKRETLPQRPQTHLSKKSKTSCETFIAFLKST